MVTTHDRIDYLKIGGCLCWFLGLLLSITAETSHADAPKPRWTASIIKGAEAIHALPETLLVMGNGGLTALNRQDGQPLWHIEALHTDKIEGTLRTQENRDCTLVGVTTPKRQPQVAVVLYSHSHHVFEEPDLKDISDSWEADLRGIEAHTGKELWRSPLELDPKLRAYEPFNHLKEHPLGVYGQTIVLNKSGAPELPLFRNARTGAALDTVRPQDIAFLRESVALYGERYAWASPSQLITLDPTAGQPITLSSLILGFDEQLIGKVGEKMVFFVSTDDGNTGHSNWPNYILCCDVRGKRL